MTNRFAVIGWFVIDDASYYYAIILLYYYYAVYKCMFMKHELGRSVVYWYVDSQSDENLKYK